MSLLDPVGPCGAADAARHQVVCRDVWALHLSLLPAPPSAEPYFHAQPQHGVQPPPAGEQTTGDKIPDKTPAEAIDDDDDDAKSTSTSLSEDDDDLDLNELLRENSVAPSSSSEDENGDESHPRAQQKQQKHKSGYRPYDSPAANIAVLMLACWTLRLPMMYMDFKR